MTSSETSYPWPERKVNSSLLRYRSAEIDASYLGMALAPFRVIGAGKIRADAEEERRRQWGEKGVVRLIEDAFMR